ncbi:urease accessory protein [Streptomyces sp. NP160]|uniref:urease accessory protein UreF n=1 Tax=Streptomyces sp. NP160 TaxID=2586637 RepID=UPI001118B303|nr:urease accessory UreF family protein [Streptomyces sp. NP160]TNM60662.1 urease accessory protein [Streptomyces sp. NP160]
MTAASLLALADSRLPAGGHAHSAGTEQAVLDGYVRDEASLATLLRRRLLTAGVVAAHLAAAACAAPQTGALRALDGEAEVRLPAPAAREASRAQGRGLVRVASVAWPSAAWAALREVARAPHHPLAVGVAAAAAGGSPRDAALVALYLTGTAPATAAARLLGLDPVTVAAVLAGLGPLQDALAGEAADAVARGQEPPSESDPLTDLLVTRHAPRQDKLFAS